MLNARSATSADEFLAVLDRGLARQQLAVAQWLPAADEAAAGFLEGGRLLVGGPAPDFESEASYRSGGLMPLTLLASAGTPGPLDAAMLGFSGPEAGDAATVRQLSASGATVIGFGLRAQRQPVAAACACWIDSQAEPLDGLPVAGILDVAALWAFVGEFVAACTRAGAMPPMWQSAVLPGSEVRNKRYAGVRLHAGPPPAAVPPMVVAHAYLAALRAHLTGFADGERERLRQAGEEVRRARADGHHAWFLMDGGHLPATSLALPDGPRGLEWLTRPQEPNDWRGVLQPGDFVYVQGYTEPPVALVAAAHAVGASVCVSLAGRDGQPALQTAADMVLDAQWQRGDAAVPIPGYEVPILPPSGFMAAAIYWALVLEAASPA